MAEYDKKYDHVVEKIKNAHIMLKERLERKGIKLEFPDGKTIVDLALEKYEALASGKK